MGHHTYFTNSNLLIGIFILILAVIILYKTREDKSKNLKHSENKIRDNFDSLVISMLNQNNGALMQPEISSNLNISLDTVSVELIRMEEENLIKRVWINEQYTYKIILIK